MVTDNAVITTTQYAGGYIYENSSLKFANHAEGYIEPDGGGGYDYVYQYKDHLGNVRLSYSDANNDGLVGVSEIIEESNYYPFGLKHRGYNDIINGILNKFLTYNGKEWEEALNLNLYGMDMRQYDPAIARWTGIDPITHYSMSPYVAFDNNPVFWSDPSGADSWQYDWKSNDGTYINTSTKERSKDWQKAVDDTVAEEASWNNLTSNHFRLIAADNGITNPKTQEKLFEALFHQYKGKGTNLTYSPNSTGIETGDGRTVSPDGVASIVEVEQKKGGRIDIDIDQKSSYYEVKLKKPGSIITMSSSNKQGERMLEALNNGDHDRSLITYVTTSDVKIDTDFINNNYDIPIKQLNAQWRITNGILEIRFINVSSNIIERVLESFADPDPVQINKNNVNSILRKYSPYLKN